MFRTVPPAPVTAFRYPELLTRQFHFGGVPMVGVGVKEFARFRQQVPGEVVFFGSDPNIKVGVDPRTRNDVRERPRLNGFRGFTRRQGPEAGIGGDPAVKGAQKFAAVSREKLPGVLAVENNGDHGRPLPGAARGGVNAPVEVLGGRPGGHSRIDETNQVGKLVVPEEERDRPLAAGKLVRAIKLAPVRNRSIAAALERLAERPPEHAFIRRRPFNALFGCEAEDLVRKAALAWPHAPRRAAK